MRITLLNKNTQALTTLIPDTQWKELFYQGIDEAFINTLPITMDKLTKKSLSIGREQLLCLIFYKYTQIPTADLLFFLKNTLGFNSLEIFNFAITQARLDWIDELNLSQNDVVGLIQNAHYTSFKIAAKHGHLDVINWIKAQLSSDDFLAMLKTSFNAFGAAAEYGHLHILKWFQEQVKPNSLLFFVRANNYYAFRSAAENNYLAILRWHKEVAIKEFDLMIRAADFFAFKWAALNEHNPCVDWLLLNSISCFAHAENKDKEYGTKYIYPIVDALLHSFHKRQAQVEYADQFDIEHIAQIHLLFYMARNLVRRNNSDLQVEIEFILSIPSVQKLIHPESTPVYFNELFLTALDHSNHKAIDSLLSPSIIAIIFKALHYNENSRSASVFEAAESVDDRLLFYVLRKLIKENKPEQHENILFLTTIPAVRRILHHAITPNYSNELLRTAVTHNHQFAIDTLLAIPEVRLLAVQNNFYRADSVVPLNLRTLARDDESSMNALKSIEKKQLEALTSRYKPTIETYGLNKILAILREDLVERYRLKPAQVMVKGQLTDLPVFYSEFEKLVLTKAEKNAALIGYYQHTDHSAWRFLLKPNPWIHSQAKYTQSYIDDSSKKWACFEEYRFMISLFYIAVKDTNIMSINGYTNATRLDHFIAELALIARAHNWDKTKHYVDLKGKKKTKEYDDLEADKPSCFPGINRRLFQSVQGHPLLNIITKETIKAEIRNFVREHFSMAITDENRQKLREARDTYFLTLEHEQVIVLKDLDISAEMQTAFIHHLRKKYGAPFRNEPGFELQIKIAFSLGKDEAHVLNFDYMNIEQLLSEPENPLPSIAQNPQTMFGGSAQATKDTDEVKEAHLVQHANELRQAI